MAKYASLNNLSTLTDNIKKLFATKIEVDNAVAQKSQVQIVTSESTEALSTLQIHPLTQEEYDEKIASGAIEENAIYLTPDEEIDLSEYATKEYVDSKEVPYEILENGNVVFENDVLANKNISVQKTSTELGDLKNSVGNLENYWQYSESTTDVVRAINQNAEWVLANFEQHGNKTNDILDNKDSKTLYPSVKAAYDLFAPHIIYDDSTGFEASNNNTGDTWHLTGLDLSKYRRLKFYVSAGGDSDANYSPPHIVEMTLDDRAKGSFGYFFATSAAHCPNNRNRHHIVSFAVNAEKTAIQFQHAISLYGTAASNSAGGRRCYLIEGYLI